MTGAPEGTAYRVKSGDKEVDFDWRVEGGLSHAKAPDLSIVGFSLGSSFDARLVGRLDFELRLQGTAFPCRQFDSQVALAYKRLDGWVFRMGWRTIALDDAGLVGGEEGLRAA